MTKYFKVKITKHTKLLFGNTFEDMWHKKSIGETILVKNAPYENSAFYEAKNGNSILKSDCKKVRKNVN